MPVNKKCAVTRRVTEVVLLRMINLLQCAVIHLATLSRTISLTSSTMLAYTGMYRCMQLRWNTLMISLCPLTSLILKVSHHCHIVVVSCWLLVCCCFVSCSRSWCHVTLVVLCWLLYCVWVKSGPQNKSL